LNKDVPYFAQVVPTAENIALYVQRLLTLPLRELGVQLHRVRLQESPNNSSEVYGEFPLEELGAATAATTYPASEGKRDPSEVEPLAAGRAEPAAYAGSG
jgi:6-pyruvoyltetrahydropterin/6-carboxytetrahydropterin synthase